MNVLVATTGVPKSTILFYLSQGLLPQPRRTSPNMAYYEPACVERIRLIQQMQERHRLTLSEITDNAWTMRIEDPSSGSILNSTRRSSAPAAPGGCWTPKPSAVRQA
jgi:hypothetical protein